MIDVSLKVRPGCACPPEALLRAAARAAAAHGGRSSRRGRGAGGSEPWDSRRGFLGGPRGTSAKIAFDEGEHPTLSGTRCASVHGFSLHANTHIAAHRRDQLERLIRYTARGAVSLERLGQDEGGDLLYTFTRVWSDGTMGIKLSPLELLEKLAALVPPPRLHQVRYTGCLAAHRNLRRSITPTPRQQGIEASARPVSSRWGWARLLKRVLAIDLERCPRCQLGSLRIISALT